jgi:hypothetical protein
MKDNVKIESIVVVLTRDLDQMKQGDVIVIEPRPGPMVGEYVLDSRKLYKWDGVSPVLHYKGSAVSVERNL